MLTLLRSDSWYMALNDLILWMYRIEAWLQAMLDGQRPRTIRRLEIPVAETGVFYRLRLGI